MGFSIYMIAVRGKSASTIHSEFGVEATGEFEDPPESPVCGVLLPSGWYLIWVNDRIDPGNVALQKLSTGADVLMCWAEEHVMNCLTVCWRNGREVWSVWHDAQEGVEHLETRGDLPPSYAAARAEMTSMQTTADGVDYIFEIPLELFVLSTGYRYSGPNNPEPQFERLNRIRPPKQWWQFWKRD